MAEGLTVAQEAFRLGLAGDVDGPFYGRGLRDVMSAIKARTSRGERRDRADASAVPVSARRAHRGEPIVSRRRVTEAIDRERAAMTARGFTGRAGTRLWAAVDVGHLLAIVEYVFPDGARRPYVEVAESHEGAFAARIWPLPEVVHLLQNVSEDELFAIGNREPSVSNKSTQGHP